MSSSIQAVNQLVTAIRSQLTGRLPPATGKGAALLKPARPSDRYAEENLSALIELRIGQIGPDDPQRGRKAFRVFLEAVLLSHFGEQLVNDTKFHQLVDEVQGALERDPSSSAMVGSAIDHLLSRQA